MTPRRPWPASLADLPTWVWLWLALLASLLAAPWLWLYYAWVAGRLLTCRAVEALLPRG